MYDVNRQTAFPGGRSACPSCRSQVMAKCGRIIIWHWAHVAAECDPWSEPESAWHLAWKGHLETMGAKVEVPMGPHRADAVMPAGHVIELQAHYLDAASISARESFYGPTMHWLYRCTWVDRLQWGGLRVLVEEREQGDDDASAKYLVARWRGVVESQVESRPWQPGSGPHH